MEKIKNLRENLNLASGEFKARFKHHWYNIRHFMAKMVAEMVRYLIRVTVVLCYIALRLSWVLVDGFYVVVGCILLAFAIMGLKEDIARVMRLTRHAEARDKDVFKDKIIRILQKLEKKM